MNARVLHIVNALTPGGAEQTVCGLARHAHARGAAVRVLVLARRGELADELTAAGIAVVEARFTQWWRVWRLAAVVRCLREFKPDIVHAHLFAAELAAVAAARLANYRGRLIVSKYENGYWMGARHRLAERLFTVPRADRVICDSATLPPLLAARGFARGRCAVVYPLVAEEFAAVAAPAITDGFTVLLPARLDAVKGHDTLIAATALLRRDELPGLRVRFAGDGPMREALATAVTAAGVAERVTFAGSRRDMPEQLRLAAVVALPSWAETTPLALLEAMAAGRAIVATNLPGICEILANEREALLVPPGDAPALAAALRRLHDDPALRLALGERARARYLRDFSAAAQLQKMDEIYAGS